MPSHTSHALQALDRSIFGALKKLVKKILARYQIEHQHFKLFQQAWQDAACESNAASGFATTGVFPLDKCWVQNHSELFRLSEPFHDKAIEIHQIEARLEACDPADPSRARLQASLDAPALQQFRSPSQLSWTSAPFSTCASPSPYAGRINLRVRCSCLTSQFLKTGRMSATRTRSRCCRMRPSARSARFRPSRHQARRGRSRTRIACESNASAKHLNNPERIAELAEHFDKKDRDAEVLFDNQQAKHTHDRFLHGSCTGSDAQ